MKKKKKASLTLEQVIIIVFVILVILLIVYLLYTQKLWDFIKNLPGYSYNRKDRVVDSLPKDQEIFMKYYKVAIVPDGRYIHFCINGDCRNAEKSNLYFSGESESYGGIYVDLDWSRDNNIGRIENNRITIESPVLEETGNIYFKIKESLPENIYLLNLDNSLYISGTVYREKAVTPVKRGIIPGETITKSEEDISYYIPEGLEKGQTSEWFKLEEYLGENEYGFEIGNLKYVQYVKTNNGKIWLRFKSTGVFSDDITDWILMDYWNKYQSFAGVGEEYVSED
ncbi:MAG: hypothetical protein Q8N99_04150 [Nanoarchaeota archaeon]|nr:hypothetical protein [Nanoarchaeota archaeon]